ncbi:hypothetical protein EDC01DRAFT_774621, partial [Geopyxis carbonaria]
MTEVLPEIDILEDAGDVDESTFPHACHAPGCIRRFERRQDKDAHNKHLHQVDMKITCKGGGKARMGATRSCTRTTGRTPGRKFVLACSSSRRSGTCWLRDRMRRRQRSSRWAAPILGDRQRLYAAQRRNRESTPDGGAPRQRDPGPETAPARVPALWRHGEASARPARRSVRRARSAIVAPANDPRPVEALEAADDDSDDDSETRREERIGYLDRVAKGRRLQDEPEEELEDRYDAAHKVVVCLAHGYAIQKGPDSIWSHIKNQHSGKCLKSHQELLA